MPKILIIEDNPAVRLLTKDLLEGENYQVDTASDGQEGRAKVKHFLPDLLVLDLTLPDDFGLDICKDVKKTNPGLLVFMLTALGSAQDAVAGLEAGADDYLAKPFNQREFMARVKLLLKKGGKI